MERYFEWDTVKAASNFRKHGVLFEDAAKVFDDPFAQSEQDRYENGQERWQTMGVVSGQVLVMVAHTLFLENDGSELVRIISARRADKKERNRYEHGQN